MTQDTYKDAFIEAFPQNKKQKPSGINGFSTGIGMLGVSAAVGGFLLGGLTKMFGNTEELPKGVVKEMMHGLMLGVNDLIAEKEQELKDLTQRVEMRDNEIKIIVSEKDEMQQKYDNILTLIGDMKAKSNVESKKPYTGKKRGPKPKKKLGRPPKKK